MMRKEDENCTQKIMTAEVIGHSSGDIRSRDMET